MLASLAPELSWSHGYVRGRSATWRSVEPCFHERSSFAGCGVEVSCRIQQCSGLWNLHPVRTFDYTSLQRYRKDVEPSSRADLTAALTVVARDMSQSRSRSLNMHPERWRTQGHHGRKVEYIKSHRPMRKCIRSKSTIADPFLLSTLQRTNAETLRTCCAQLFPSMTTRLGQWKRPDFDKECLDIVARYYLIAMLEQSTRIASNWIQVVFMFKQHTHGPLLWHFKSHPDI
jgi:hypothetical protein